MLELKKSSKSNEIHIQLKPKYGFFDKSFLIALTIALTIHFGAALLFHVRLFSNRQFEAILPPTNTYAHFVKSSAEENDAIVIAKVDTEGRLTPAQLIPPTSSPKLLTADLPTLIKKFDIKEFDLSYNPFNEIERDIEENYFTHLDLPLVASPVKIAIAGPLANIPINAFDDRFHSFFELQQFPPHQYSQKRVVYTVQVDMNSGQIFWFQPQENTLEPSQIVIAEKLLKNLLFLSSTQEFMLNGEIEMTFTNLLRKLT